MTKLLSTHFLSLTLIWRFALRGTLAFAVASSVHAEQPPKKAAVSIITPQTTNAGTKFVLRIVSPSTTETTL